MKKNIVIVLISTSFLGLSGIVYAGHHDAGEVDLKEHKGKAHHHKKSPQRMLKKVDVNQDGKVDLNEFLAHAEQRFTKMDLNSDGFLTLEEGREAHKQMRTKHKAERKAHKAKHKQNMKNGSDE